MRRIFAAVLAAICLLSLSACGGKKADAPWKTSAVQTVEKADAFSEELEELDGDTAFLLYALADQGLSREDLTDCAVLRSAGATCEECAVLIFSGPEQAAKAETAMKDYVQSQIEENRDYRPDDIPKLENAVLSLRENTLLLIVAADTKAAEAALS